MPPANMAVTAAKEPSESCAMPESPWPEVQPSAMRAPIGIKKLAAKAVLKRPAVPSPVTRDQSFGTPLRRAPGSLAEAKMPRRIAHGLDAGIKKLSYRKH